MMAVEGQVEVQPRRKERGEHKAPTGGGTPLPRTMGFDEEESKSNGGGGGGLMASSSPIRRVTRSSQGSRGGGGGGSRRGSRAGGMGSGMGMGMLQDRPRSAASGGFRPGSRQSQRVGMGMGAGAMGDEDVRSVVSRASRGRARRAAGSPVGASMGMGMGVTGAVPAGMAADPANGHVRAVRAGTHRRKTQVMADGRTVSSVDLEATEEKMRRILGRSWQGIYHDVRRVGAGHGHGHGQGSSPLRASGGARGGVMGSSSGGGGGAFGGTSLRFGGGGAVPQTHGVDSGVLRDILAKRGVPMTTGEMKRLERRFPSRQGSRARSGVGMGASASSRGGRGGFGAGAGAGTAGEGEIDYHAMLARTFSRSGGRRR